MIGILQKRKTLDSKGFSNNSYIQKESEMNIMAFIYIIIIS